MDEDTLRLNVQDTAVELSYLHQAGALPPLVCLHGFGSTKEDYADLRLHPDFADRALLFWDAPGFGASRIPDHATLSIPFLVDVAIAACDALGLARFHLSGHSMGGLTGLMLAHAHPDRVSSFIDIEGNVAPEDCFLSRQILEFPAETPEAFAEGFIARVRARDEYSAALYAASLPHKVQAESYAPIFQSMVALSDNEPLLDMIAGLPCPRTFVYGAQNAHLSYLGSLPERGVATCEIAASGHFPMYANPPALWAAIAAHLREAEA